MNTNDPLLVSIVELMGSSATEDECKVIRGIMDLPNEHGEVNLRWYINRMQRNPDNCKRNFIMWIEDHHDKVKHNCYIPYKY